MINQYELQDIGYSSLDAIEEILGNREILKFKGFYFWDRGNPQLIGTRSSGFKIFVSDLAKSSEYEAVFQTSHEVVHLISPTTKDNVSILEEGLATYFSIDQLRKKGFNSSADSYLVHLENYYQNYFRAYELVSNVPDIYSKIKSWRDSNLNQIISNLTVFEINEILDCELTLASELARKFNI